jgi:hypothetical protein
LNKKQRETFFVYNWNARDEVAAKQNESEAAIRVAGWPAGRDGQLRDLAKLHLLGCKKRDPARHMCDEEERE